MNTLLSCNSSLLLQPYSLKISGRPSCRGGRQPSSFTFTTTTTFNTSRSAISSLILHKTTATPPPPPGIVRVLTEETPLLDDINGGGDEGFKGGGDGNGGGGNGDGSGGGKNEEGGEGVEKKKVGMSMSQKLTLAYAVLVGVGGVMGYVKGGSQKSLAAGGLSALLLFFVYSKLPHYPVLASSLGLGLSAALLGVMGSRFKNSGKIFPAGVVSLVSLVMTGGYLHGIMRGMHG